MPKLEKPEPQPVVALDAALLDKVRSPIQSTWGVIYPDAGRCSNVEALELCLDADRLTFHADAHVAAEHKEADRLIEAALNQHSYQKVMRFLSKNIRLV